MAKGQRASKARWLGRGLFLAASFGVASAAYAASGADCDRACLQGMMTTYMSALAAHDPSRLPVASTVRYTENGSELKLGGEGLWATFNKAEPYRHDVVDPETGGIASYFTIVENKLLPFHDLLAVRLKVRNRRITEIETVVNRHARAAGNMLTLKPSWMEEMERIEAPATRLTREQLIEATIGYMRAIAFHDGKAAPFAKSCIRLENGNITAIGKDDVSPVPIGSGPPVSTDTIPGLPPQAPPPKLMGLGCDEQLDYMAYSFITGFRDAHFPVIDVERQKVYAVFDFMRRGNVEAWTWNGNTYPMPEAMRYPNEILNTEIFKFSGGKLTRVEAVFTGPQAYKRGTGWPGGGKEESLPYKASQP